MPEIRFEEQTFHFKNWKVLMYIMQFHSLTSLGLSFLISGVKKSLLLIKIL